MKKVFALFVTIALFSCSQEEAMPADDLDHALLQKVIFYPETETPAVYDFYENGLIKSMQDQNSTKTFTYDSNNNLIRVKATGGPNYDIPFTYDANNIMTSANGYLVTYENNITDGKYTMHYGLDPQEGVAIPDRVEYEVDQDLLILNSRVFYFAPFEEFNSSPTDIIYLNGNMQTIGWESFQTQIDFLQFDNQANPLRRAVLPAFRAVMMFDPYSLIAGSMISNNNVISQSYPGEAISHSYSYTYNEYGLPVTKTIQNYLNGVPDGAPYEFAHYYYKGDVVP